MGWWKLECWKEKDVNGQPVAVDLTAEDFDHIADQIKDGYVEGELNDEEEATPI